MRRLAVALVVAGALAGRAEAFTNAEMLSLQQFHTANSNMGNAGNQLGTMVYFTNATNLPFLKSAWKGIDAWALNQGRAISYLFGIDPDTGASCGSRATCVNAANIAVTAAKAGLTTAKTAFDNCKDIAQTCGAASSATLRTAASSAASFTGAAQTNLNAYDTGLLYTNYQPVFYPRVFGPHGDWDATVYSMVQAVATVAAGLDGAADAYDWLTNGDTIYTSGSAASCSGSDSANSGFMAWCRIVIRIQANIMVKMMSGLLYFGTIPKVGDTKSPVRQIGDFLEHLISGNSETEARDHCCAGLPYHYDNGGIDSWTINMRDMQTRPVARALMMTAWPNMVVHAWMHSDNAVLNSFKMPGTSQDDATLRAIRAAKNKWNDPAAPPMSTLHP